jgi:hypothetical protein
MIWELLDSDTCAVTEQQVLVTLGVVQGALCNRLDLIPSAERLLPSLVLDLALLLGEFFGSSTCVSSNVLSCCFLVTFPPHVISCFIHVYTGQVKKMLLISIIHYSSLI